jgi:Mn-dependent DtxR family transcriptional regulator
MPISITEFETVDPEEERSTAELIVEFLLENNEQAFTRSEIATAIDRAPNTVGTNLSRLKERGLVRHL